MEKIFTIGFTEKTAEDFFGLLKKNSVHLLSDIRLKNSSQIAGFSKGIDLKYFLTFFNIGYIHDLKFAPSKKILHDFKNKKISWDDYKIEFLTLMEERGISEHIEKFYSKADNVCFLCSEPTAENCHRKIVAERLQMTFREVEIIHL